MYIKVCEIQTLFNFNLTVVGIKLRGIQNVLVKGTRQNVELPKTFHVIKDQFRTFRKQQVDWSYCTRSQFIDQQFKNRSGKRTVQIIKGHISWDIVGPWPVPGLRVPLDTSTLSVAMETFTLWVVYCDVIALFSVDLERWERYHDTRHVVIVSLLLCQPLKSLAS